MRNDLEAYSYEMRNNLEDYGNFVNYIDPAVRTPFLAEISEVIEWLYADGENAPLNDYEVRLEKFRKIGEAVRTRYRFYEAWPSTISAYDKLVEKISTKLSESTTLTEEYRGQIIKKCEVLAEFFDKMKADLAAQKQWDDPAVTNEAALEKFRLLDSECTAIFVKPPPKPKKEEEAKTEEKKAEEEPSPAAEE